LAFISFYAIWHLDVPDYNGYMASAYWLLLAGAGALAGRALAFGRRAASGMVALALIACTFAPPHVAARTRYRDRLARALAVRVLSEAPARSVVIALADHFAGSLFYLQQAEIERPD